MLPLPCVAAPPATKLSVFCVAEALVAATKLICAYAPLAAQKRSASAPRHGKHIRRAELANAWRRRVCFAIEPLIGTSIGPFLAEYDLAMYRRDENATAN